MAGRIAQRPEQQAYDFDALGAKRHDADNRQAEVSAVVAVDAARAT